MLWVKLHYNLRCAAVEAFRWLLRGVLLLTAL